MLGDNYLGTRVRSLLLFVLLLPGGAIGAASFSHNPGTGVNTSMLPSRFNLNYSTYLGGSAFDIAQGVFVDAQGFIYLAGMASSAEFPTTASAFDRTINGPSGNVYDSQDGFGAKFSPSGALLWSTLLGGSRRDDAYQLRVDARGDVYVVGATGSRDFLSDAPPPTPGFDQTFNGPTITNGYGDIFIVKLHRDGGRILYWTYVGGSGEDTSRGNLYLNADGSLYISGHTTSADLPIPAGMSPPPIKQTKPRVMM